MKLKIKIQYLEQSYIFVLTICILILSGFAVTNVYPIIYPTIAISLLLLCIPITKYIMKSSLKIKLVTLLLFLMFTFPIVNNIGNYKYCISVITFMIMALMITKVIPYKQFIYAYIRIITVVAVISLVGYGIVNYTSTYIPFISMNSINDGVSYEIGFIYNYLPYQKDRNCGVFWEPGLFATHLVIAYLLILRDKCRNTILCKALFLLTIITTKSSAGYCLMILCIFLEITMRFCRKTNKKQIIFLLFLIFIILIFAFFISSNEEILSAVLFGSGYNIGTAHILEKLRIENIFSSQRGSAVAFWITKFVENPLIGRGFVEINEQYIWDTCTSFMFVGGCGILGFTYTYCWIKGISAIKDLNIPSKLLVFGIISIILNKEPHAKILSTWIILFYLLSNEKCFIKAKRNLQNHKD